MQSLIQNTFGPNRLITVGELMALAQIGRTTVYAEVDRGHLRPIKVGRATRFWLAEVLAWLGHI